MSGRGRPRGGPSLSQNRIQSTSSSASNENGSIVSPPGKWPSSNHSSRSSSRGSSPSPKEAGVILSPTRGRGHRGRPPKTLNRIPQFSSSIKRRLSMDDGSLNLKMEEKKLIKKHRRPKFQDNPPAPEIVEKGVLLSAVDVVESKSDKTEHNDNERSIVEQINKLEPNGNVTVSRYENKDESGEEPSYAPKRLKFDSQISEKNSKIRGDITENERNSVENAVSLLVYDLVSTLDDKNSDLVSLKSSKVPMKIKQKESSSEKKHIALIKLKENLVRTLMEAVNSNSETPETVSNLIAILRVSVAEVIKSTFKGVSSSSLILWKATMISEISSTIKDFLNDRLFHGEKVFFSVSKLIEMEMKQKVSEIEEELVMKVLNGFDKIFKDFDGTRFEEWSFSSKGIEEAKKMLDENDEVDMSEPDEQKVIPEQSVLKINEHSTQVNQTFLPSLDKSKLFSKMEDTFAKDTFQGLRSKLYPMQSNLPLLRWDIAEDFSDKLPKRTVELNNPSLNNREEFIDKSVLNEFPTELRSVDSKESVREGQNFPFQPSGVLGANIKQLESAEQATGESDLTKSLRKIRVSKSRILSLSDVNDNEDQASAYNSFDCMKPPKLESEMGCITEGNKNEKKVPRLEASKPLEIIIPNNENCFHKESGSLSSPHRSLLTPSMSFSRVMSQKRRRLFPGSRAYLISDDLTIESLNRVSIEQLDIGSIFDTVLCNPPSSGSKNSRKGHNSGCKGASCMMVNLNCDFANDLNFAQVQPSLKTVIRLPKSSNEVVRKKGSLNYGEIVSDGRKRKVRPIGDNAGNSISPIARRDAENLIGNGDGFTSEQHQTGYSISSGRTRTPDNHLIDSNALAESMVVPEKASSFNIHPERCCSDTCHLCGTKFGILDTPLHVSQLKTPKIKTFAMEFAGISSDACLCDKCFRYIDRKGKAKNDSSNISRVGDIGDPKGRGSQCTEKIRTCLVRNCNREVSASVSKKWLIRLRKKLTKKVALDWDRVTRGSAKSTFPLCNKHNALVDSYSHCGLCKRKLSIGGICVLGMTKEEVSAMNAALRADNLPSELHENSFLCKLCKTFCGIYRQKLQDPEYLKVNKQHKAFFKEHKKKLHGYLGVESDGYSTESQSSPKKIHQVSQSDNPTKITIKTTTLDVQNDRQGRKRKPHHREFTSPNSEARIIVDADFEPHNQHLGSDSQTQTIGTVYPSNSRNGGNLLTVASSGVMNPHASDQDRCSITIQFDVNTRKLWRDLHYPYGNYTSFLRHLILLEKYWRNGDLVIDSNAGKKASVYLQSVKNRLNAYEDKHKRSQDDLSESTRPNLDMSSFTHSSAGEDKNKVNGLESTIPDPANVTTLTCLRANTSSGANIDNFDIQGKVSDSTILRIPKVPVLQQNSNSMNQGTTEGSSTSTVSSSGNLPTKIRVRTDLLHLGLMATPEPNVLLEPIERSPLLQNISSARRSDSSSFNIADLVAPAVSPTYKKGTAPPSKGTRNSLIQFLNDTQVRSETMQENNSHTCVGPHLGSTSLIAPSQGNKIVQSSNSQLFKGSASDSGSGAIALTFNNSIAEVLTAAASCKLNNKKKNDNPPVVRPEVTITSKPLQGQQGSATQHQKQTHHHSKSTITSALKKSLSHSQSLMLPDTQSLQQAMLWESEENLNLRTLITSGKGTSALSSLPPSAGGVATSSSKPCHASSTVPAHSGNIMNSTKMTSSASQIHPLVDMSKMIHSQAPGIAPHIIAQSTISSATKSTSSVLSKSVTHQSTSLSSNHPPHIKNKAAGIQTVNKKSLNTVLNRLNSLSANVTLVTTHSSKDTNSISGSSLVQQLQAPPIAYINSKPQINSSVNRAQKSSLCSSSATDLSLNPFLSGLQGVSGSSESMVGQPIAQFPSWEQTQAALLMAAGIPGMTSVQTAAAMQELMKLSLQQQPQAPVSFHSPGSTHASRVQAPPPQNQMGRGGGGGVTPNKSKNND